MKGLRINYFIIIYTLIPMKENKGYNHYRNITNKVGKNNLRILSGRYEIFNRQYKYIYNDILEKLQIKIRTIFLT